LDVYLVYKSKYVGRHSVWLISGLKDWYENV